MPRKTARLMPLFPVWPQRRRQQRSSNDNRAIDRHRPALARCRTDQARSHRLLGDCSSTPPGEVRDIVCITVRKLAMNAASLLAARIFGPEQRDLMALIEVIEVHGRAPHRKRELGGLSAARKPTGESTRDCFF